MALIKDAADREDITVGEPGVKLATSIGAVPVKVVGIFKFGDNESVGGATFVLTTFRDAQKWFEREGETSRVVASAEEGVSPNQLKANLQKALPDTRRSRPARRTRRPRPTRSRATSTASCRRC